jgi:SAM-dependent methyltransferase
MATRRRSDPELLAATSAHYEDPTYYTHTYRSRVDDVRYYVDLAVSRKGPVLEYGCGNGRITIPIARSGIEITGIDQSAPMLRDLKARLRAEPPHVRTLVSTKRGDMRAVRTGRAFPLILCPFNAFLHLYTRTDVERFLARVREHLGARGEFVLDVSIPEPSELARDPRRAYHTPRFRYPDSQGGSGEVVRYSERFDYDRFRQILFVTMEFSPLGKTSSWMTPLAHRQFFPQELEALLHYNGLEITSRCGDFFGAGLSADSAVLVLHCRRRRGYGR